MVLIARIEYPPVQGSILFIALKCDMQVQICGRYIKMNKLTFNFVIQCFQMSARRGASVLYDDELAF